MRILVTRKRNDTMQMSMPPILCFKDYPKISTSSSITTLKQKQFGTTSKCFLQVLGSQKKTESQLYDEFERFKMLPGENINEYYVRFHKLVNDMSNIRMKMPNIQLNSKFVNNMSPEWDRFVTTVKLKKGNGAQNRAGNANAGQGKLDKMLLMQAQENGAVLDEEELLFLADVDDEPTAQTIFMANLSSVGSANPQAGPSNASILSEVNNISVVPSCASSTLNNVCVSSDNDAFVPHDPISNELKIYKEQVAIYEQRDKFELTERE
ncbi:hypothetical protein Tco_1184844 [Tanacetum coccineum]